MTLKKEFVHLHAFAVLKQLRAGIFDYVETYYNRRRIHSTINYMTPVEYEAKFDREHPQAA